MHQSPGRRRRQAYTGTRRRTGHVEGYELVVILLVLAAVIGLFVWIAVNAGGGHFLL